MPVKSQINLIEKYQIKRELNFLAAIGEKTINPLRLKYPNISFNIDLQRIAGIGYYDSFCFKISAKNSKGQEFPLADGGLTDWTKKLIGSKKERLLISGFGSELFCKNFKKSP